MRLHRALALTVLFACAGPSVASDPPPAVAAKADTHAFQLTDAEWKARLSAEEYYILRQKGTERPFTGRYWDNHADGVYVCAGCGQPLFSSADKFDSGTGWPSYTRPISPDAAETGTDSSVGMVRDEVMCHNCGGHLGHVFDDGPAPTGQRWCIDGNGLRFIPAAEADPPG